MHTPVAVSHVSIIKFDDRNQLSLHTSMRLAIAGNLHRRFNDSTFKTLNFRLYGLIAGVGNHKKLTTNIKSLDGRSGLSPGLVSFPTNSINCMNFHLHIAFLDVLEARRHIVRDFLPDGDSQLSLQLGGMVDLRGQDGAERLNLFFDARQFLAPFGALCFLLLEAKAGELVVGFRGRADRAGGRAIRQFTGSV